MWFFYRPDAASALEDPGVLKALPRYVDIVKNRKLAKFKIARMIGIEEIPTENLKELWEIHKKAMDEYQRLERLLDYGKIKPSELPNFSLLHLKSAIADKLLESCILCEHRCKKDRSRGNLGYCKVGKEMFVSSYFDHVGEEPEIVPSFTVCGRVDRPN
ncbi:MAG: hypothetical protein NZ922_03770 [Candidatus Methanomethyliaceae archaeon]|nr:hypothetical protein [Candidatus Methanomethyliaceae archaeon]MDW7971190.1 hypothetical protein [Nitrososphaerota archaeon]